MDNKEFIHTQISLIKIGRELSAMKIKEFIATLDSTLAKVIAVPDIDETKMAAARTNIVASRKFAEACLIAQEQFGETTKAMRNPDRPNEKADTRF